MNRTITILSALLLACSTSSSGDAGSTAPSIAGACGREPSCGALTSDCTAELTQLQQNCMQAGDPNDFQTYLTCRASANYDCDAGIPTTTDCNAEFTNVINGCLGGGGD